MGETLRRLAGLMGLGAPGGKMLPVLAENNAACREVDQDRPLAEQVFTVLDCEMTGLSARRDAIVSLGAVRIRKLRIIPSERYYALIRPEIPLPKLSALIHRITPERLASAPPLEEVLPGFVEFFRGTLLVGHHVGLDMAFLSRACRRLYGASPANPCLDSMRLAMAWRERLFENHYDRYNLGVSYNLGDLAREWGLPLFPAHNAYCDALQTAYLFLYLAKKLGGPDMTLRQLYLSGRGWKWYL